MKVIIVGSGISGMSAAIEAASLGIEVELLSNQPSERSQSVMAAGGINAVDMVSGNEDTIESHIQDTYKGGCFIENVEDIQCLCSNAPSHIDFIESLGVLFSRDENNHVLRRAFGGQSYRRTAFAGASTGKQIVTTLIGKCREYEAAELIKRTIGLSFHSALIHEDRCYGVLMAHPLSGEVIPFYGDSVIIATGGQNKVFGKTTGSEICDGYATGKLFSQGVTLRNLEFIQYHPTTIETAHKRMLITEAARGEGGRLFYIDGDKRVYFMEDKFGEKGNLMPRDVVSKCIYECPSQVYLDISFLDRKLIFDRLKEVYDLCKEYINLDVTKEPIPVSPSVHFFMGGIAVNIHHETNIHDLYAVGECASMYHGANRLGGNSLLSAVHSGREAARSISNNHTNQKTGEEVFADYIKSVEDELKIFKNTKSKFPVAYILKDLAGIMNTNLGITRDNEGLESGIEQVDYYLDILSKLKFDPEVSVYENYRIYYMMLLAKTILLSAKERRESRGSHQRLDYTDTLDEYKKSSYATFENEKINISYM